MMREAQSLPARVALSGDRQRRGVRVYLVELSDVDLAALLDAGLISDIDALDSVRVGFVIGRLAKGKIYKTETRYAAGRKFVH
jgi:hypothetical protein